MARFNSCCLITIIGSQLEKVLWQSRQTLLLNSCIPAKESPKTWVCTHISKNYGFLHSKNETEKKTFELQHVLQKKWRWSISSRRVLSSNLVVRCPQPCRKTKTSGWQLASLSLSASMSRFNLIFNSHESPKLLLHNSLLLALLSPRGFTFHFPFHYFM